MINKLLVGVMLLALSCVADDIIVRYAVVPTPLMATEIPVTDPPIAYSTERDGSQRTLRTFVFSHLTWDLPNGETLFRLACDESGKGYRYKTGTKDKHLLDWDYFLAAYGYGEDTWLTQEEAMDLLIEQGLIDE